MEILPICKRVELRYFLRFVENAEETLAKLIEQRLSALNTNAFAFEKAHGLPADAVRSVLRGGKKSGTALNRAQELCTALGLELYIGPPRAPQADADGPLMKADLTEIPLYDAGLAAGVGCENRSEDVIDYMAFRSDWLRKIGVRPDNAALARIEGESMQPTIWSGDMVLIDRSRREIQVRKTEGSARFRSPIYAILDDGKARVKRIERPETDQVLLLSDNPDYGPQFAKIDTLSIIGKVMWWGHTNRE